MSSSRAIDITDRSTVALLSLLSRTKALSSLIVSKGKRVR